MKAKQFNPVGYWKSSEKATSFPLSRQFVWINSPDCVELTDRLLASIESARKVLWVASPFIDDERIVQSLIRARSRRVRVKVVTDIRNNRGRGKQYVTRGFQAEPEEATKFDAHQSCIRELARARISCRSPIHYPHFKLVVADDRIAILSSANLTQNSLGGSLNSSLEVGLAVGRQEQVDQLLLLLSELWSSCPFSLLLNGEDVSIEQHGCGEQVAHVAKTAAQCGLLVNSPRESFFSLTDAIVTAVNQSNREVIFASMSFFDANRVPQLEDAVLAALGRGVQVTAIIRPEHFCKEETRGEYPDPSTNRLVESGLELQGIAGQHAKGLLVDQSDGLIFSANINPYSLTSGLESHHMELGAKLSANNESFTDFAEFMNDLKRAANNRFKLAKN